MSGLLAFEQHLNDVGLGAGLPPLSPPPTFRPIPHLTAPLPKEAIVEEGPEGFNEAQPAATAAAPKGEIASPPQGRVNDGTVEITGRTDSKPNEERRSSHEEATRSVPVTELKPSQASNDLPSRSGEVAQQEYSAPHEALFLLPFVPLVVYLSIQPYRRIPRGSR